MVTAWPPIFGPGVKCVVLCLRVGRGMCGLRFFVCLLAE